jgi:hypothetical protein
MLWSVPGEAPHGLGQYKYIRLQQKYETPGIILIEFNHQNFTL